MGSTVIDRMRESFLICYNSDRLDRVIVIDWKQDCLIWQRYEIFLWFIFADSDLSITQSVASTSVQTTVQLNIEQVQDDANHVDSLIPVDGQPGTSGMYIIFVFLIFDINF